MILWRRSWSWNPWGQWSRLWEYSVYGESTEKLLKTKRIFWSGGVKGHTSNQLTLCMCTWKWLLRPSLHLRIALCIFNPNPNMKTTMWCVMNCCHLETTEFQHNNYKKTPFNYCCHVECFCSVVQQKDVWRGVLAVYESQKKSKIKIIQSLWQQWRSLLRNTITSQFS